MGRGACSSKTFGKERIFHMLHHCLAGGQRTLLIKMEITPELLSYEVQAHCHVSSLRAQGEVLCWSFAAQDREYNGRMHSTDVHVLSASFHAITKK